MRAIVQNGYGEPEDVLELREIERPPIGNDEVLLRVRAASVHPDVWHVVRGLPYVVRTMGTGMRTPKQPVPGIDAAGVVEDVGRSVTRINPGDAVFGEIVRGHQWKNGGAFAEYAAVRAEALWPKPARLSYEEAAAVPTAALIALANLRPDLRVHPGTTVVVVGAAGGVGAYAVQIATAHGARVTGIDREDKLDMVRGLGADDVIDYTTEDYTELGRKWDLVFDVVGSHGWKENKRALTPEGKYVLIGHDHYGEGMNRWLGSMPRMFRLMLRAPFEPGLDMRLERPTEEPMAAICRLIEDEQLTPVIDRTFPLEEVPAALRYLVDGRATGKVVITI